MDHRCLLDTPDEELPSARFRRAATVYVDCNSFGPRAMTLRPAGSLSRPTGDLCHEVPTHAVTRISRPSATGSVDNSSGGFFLH